MIGARCLLAAAVIAAPVPPAFAATYGDTLIAQTERRHPALVSVAIDAIGKNGAIHLERGKPAAIFVGEPLTDATGNKIGSARFTFRHASGVSSALAIAVEMGRRIYVADNLSEPDPFVAGTPHAPFAQGLVDRMIDANPDLVTLAMHVTPAGRPTNIIIASNFGRIGKEGDKDDMHVINDRVVLKEVTDSGHRLAVSLPMLDRSGAVIGALSTSFMMAQGKDTAEVEKRAVAVRDALAAEIPSRAVLAAPK